MSPVSMATVGASSKPAAWRPTNLGSALKLWLDADDSTTFTLNGSNVSQWDDKSGNGYHATQGTDTNRPTRQTNVLNSKACVRFDGVDNRMTTGYSLNGVTSFATSVVVKADSVEGSWSILRQQPNDSPYFSHPWTNGNPARIIMSWDGGVTTVNLTGSLTSAAISGFVRVSGSTNKAYLDGTEQNSRAANSSSPTFSGTLQLGYAQTTNVQYFDGDLHEVVIYNGTLSSTDREKLEGYLAHKWGLTANLPSLHPYKTTPP